MHREKTIPISTAVNRSSQEEKAIESDLYKQTKKLDVALIKFYFRIKGDDYCGEIYPACQLFHNKFVNITHCNKGC
jgi:hypothetical protein